MVQKLHICEKGVFWSAFWYSNVVFIIDSHFIIVSYFTLWTLDFFNTTRQGVKQFGPITGPTFCPAWSRSKLFAKVISGKRVDTTFWLKPWLKLISFGFNFFFWLKCWLQQILSQGNSADLGRFSRAQPNLSKAW